MTIGSLAGEIILDELIGPNLNTWVLKTGEPFLAVVWDRDVMTEEGLRCNVSVFEHREKVVGNL